MKNINNFILEKLIINKDSKSASINFKLLDVIFTNYADSYIPENQLKKYTNHISGYEYEEIIKSIDYIFKKDNNYILGCTTNDEINYGKNLFNIIINKLNDENFNKPIYNQMKTSFIKFYDDIIK